ncbi:hypothetical protein [Bacillus mycoides]|uniref:hypothetical protein n=1 Tax=Bacillus mycoides TaxID=1405 RepID=UPI0016430D11|nr:hypothetical protein [Bacillus mycoides]
MPSLSVVIDGLKQNMYRLNNEKLSKIDVHPKLLDTINNWSALFQFIPTALIQYK